MNRSIVFRDVQPSPNRIVSVGTEARIMTHTVGRDTIALPAKLKLRDGTRVLFRLVQPEDRNDLLQGFEKLSMGSRRYRFLTPIRKLSERQVKSLIEVDQLDHVAIGVKDIGKPGKPGIAIGRFVRLEDEPATAEFAVTVIDEYQNRGLGTLLTRFLMQAAGERGIEVLRGFLLDDNQAMIRLLERFGANLKRESGNVLQADLPVAPTAGTTNERG
jgi:RimJ/RimL family protein N-acetyltransferase